MPQQTLYEPRAYWSIGRVTPTALNAPVDLLLNREHFRNGTRNPVELTHMLVAMVGYTFSDFDGVLAVPVGPGDVDASTQALEKMKVTVISPSRYQFGIEPVRVASLATEQTQDVSMVQDPNFGYAAGLHGVCRWDFERPMIIPRGGSLEFGLGAPLLQPSSLDNAVTPVDARPTYTIAFTEDAGLAGGDARTKQGNLLWWGLLPTTTRYPLGQVADGLGQSANAAAAAVTTRVYDPTMGINAKEWRQQQQTQGGSTKVTGFSVAIDQIDWELAVQADPPVNGLGQPLAPLALRTPTMAPRMTDGGTKMEWWRAGAPLALVCPSMTPASVIRFPEPIMLAPGDALDVLLQFPGGFPGLPSDPVIDVPYQTGVSFCGYAHIEG